jgi:hypothetical protein
MSVWQDTTPAPSLSGADGELLAVRIAVPWNQLEDLLEALATVPFPINPEIRHGSPLTTVEFPAYSGQVGEITKAVRGTGGRDLRMEASKCWPDLVSDGR